jgi:hypothetical protein
MTKINSPRGRVAVLCAALAAIGTVAVYTVATASAAGRELEGSFCSHAVSGSPFPPGLCVQLTLDGQTTQGYYHSPGSLTLRPGDYWLTVTDTSAAHNFSLMGPDGLDTDITTVPEGSPASPVVKTVKIHLDHGSYMIMCDATGHAAAGMYVNIEVGGVGQVG